VNEKVNGLSTFAEGRAANSRPPVAEAQRISKSFGPTAALTDVSLAVSEGECHALVGRNGAGKSTLVAALTGLIKPDHGQILLAGERAPSVVDRTAWQSRVACVYQHSKVVPTLTVAENLYLNRFERRIISWRAMRSGARRMLAEWGFEVNVDLLASELSVEQRQVVEIARALTIGARFLILDEPTASLEARAVDRLFGHVRRLKESGVGVMYISHHLEEIYRICDRVTVVRDGRHILTGEVAELDQDAIISAMVGAAVVPVSTSATAAASSESRLRIEHLCVTSALGNVEDVSLEVRAGECVGLVGLRGSGSSTVGDVVAGLAKPNSGNVLLDGRPLVYGKVDGALARGVGYVPEDRHARGFVALLGVGENLTLPILPRLSRFGIVSTRRRNRAAADLATRLEIVASSTKQPVGELSGGNQQKVVVGRALSSDPSLLVLISPTVGVDVASKAALLGTVEGARAAGAAVLLVSDDLEELRIATRLLVMVRGCLVREFRERPWDEAEPIAAAEGLAA
jgi:simple sugar transport system ATP-binding protein